MKKNEPTTNSITNAITSFKDGEEKKEVFASIEAKEINQISHKENIEEDKTNQFMDTEVVDGLELSVECASDKEDLNSESEDERNVKPRSKTIIVKVKPEDSELECSSSEEEKYNSREIININASKIKSEKKNVKRKGTRNSSKMKTSASEDNQTNNSDEDYSPRTKKKIKRPTIKKQIKHIKESKKERSGDTKKSSVKKSSECTLDDDKNDKKNAECTLDDTTKITLEEESIKIKDEIEENLSENESSTSQSEDKNSEDEKESTKNRRERRSNDVRVQYII